MSTVMRPRGPLPPRVYWSRRVLLVAVVLVVGGLVWWMLPGVGSSGNAAANPNSGRVSPGQGSGPAGHGPTSPSTTHPAAEGQPTGGQPTGQGTGTASPGGGPQTTRHTTRHVPSHTTGHTSGTPSAPHHPLSAPTGPCDPTTVRLAVVVADATVGKGTTVGLRMSTPDGSACSLGITPSLLETRIVSGPAVVWQSQSCPDALPAKNVVVRPVPKVVYSYSWDGQVNPSSCSATNRIAKPGGYHAQAALIGGEPHDTYFEVAPAS